MESSFKDETGSPNLGGLQRAAVSVAGMARRMRVRLSEDPARWEHASVLEAVCAGSAEHGVHGASMWGLRVGSPCKWSES